MGKQILFLLVCGSAVASAANITSGVVRQGGDLHQGSVSIIADGDFALSVDTVRGAGYGICPDLFAACSGAVTGTVLGDVASGPLVGAGLFTDYINGTSGFVCLDSDALGPCSGYSLTLTTATVTLSGPGTYYAPFTATGDLVVQRADGSFARNTTLAGSGIAEIVMVQNNFTTYGRQSVTWTFTPEPSSYALTGSGLLFGLWLLRRRKA